LPGLENQGADGLKETDMDSRLYIIEEIKQGVALIPET
jgi:hypothetical protein